MCENFPGSVLYTEMYFNPTGQHFCLLNYLHIVFTKILNRHLHKKNGKPYQLCTFFKFLLYRVEWLYFYFFINSAIDIALNSVEGLYLIPWVTITSCTIIYDALNKDSSNSNSQLESKDLSTFKLTEKYKMVLSEILNFFFF